MDSHQEANYNPPMEKPIESHNDARPTEEIIDYCFRKKIIKIILIIIFAFSAIYAITLIRDFYLHIKNIREAFDLIDFYKAIGVDSGSKISYIIFIIYCLLAVIFLCAWCYINWKIYVAVSTRCHEEVDK
jgi:accessory gene regulator protein AgrB